MTDTCKPHPDHPPHPCQPDHPNYPASNCPPPPPDSCDPHTALISAHANVQVDHVVDANACVDIGGHDLVDLHVCADIGHDLL
jgi:hypothetical protein